MSGIFRSLSIGNASSTNFNQPNESTSSNKRLSFGALCTSPGTLQDVTMDNLYGAGYRSPCVSMQQHQGSTTPAGQGRSVREYEEQMTALRKENFNLKLRLYFLEESLPGFQQQQGNASSEGQDNLLKQLIDSKVEKEILRKEIQEQQELLKDAAGAMVQMESTQKQLELKCQSEIEELKQKILYFEMERDHDKTNNAEYIHEVLGRTELCDNMDIIQKIRQLEELLKQSEEKNIELQLQISKLDEILIQRDESIKEYEDKVKELVFQNAELLESLENKEKEISNAEIKRLQKYHLEVKNELANKISVLQESEERHKKLTHSYEQACRHLQKFTITIRDQQSEIKRLRNTQNPPHSSGVIENISEPTTIPEAIGLNQSLGDIYFEVSQKEKLQAIIDQQQETIAGLKFDIYKKTSSLQHLINKELFEKNREIERLTKLLDNSNEQPRDSEYCVVSSPGNNCELQTSLNKDLQKSFSDVQYNKALERNKVLQRKIDILIQRLSLEKSNQDVINHLHNELREARCETEKANKWRQECTDICCILTKRLEELAGFLDSLLQHKNILDVLAADNHRAIRKAVDRSLDLSKSLNMTLSLSGMSICEHQSMANMTHLSHILEDSYSTEIKTFHSHEDLHFQSNEMLRAENKALKKELDKKRSNSDAGRKERRSLPISMMNHRNNSESETWSEPDRKVSMARIGLEEPNVDATYVSSHQLETDSDSETATGSVNLNIKNNNPNDSSYQDRLRDFEKKIEQRDARIIELARQLKETESDLKKESTAVMYLKQDLQEIRIRNAKLEADFIAMAGTQPNNEDECKFLQQQVEEKIRALKKLQEDRERLSNDFQLSKIQLENLKTEMEKMHQQHKTALAEAQAHESQILDKMNRDMQQVMSKRLEEQNRIHQDALNSEYVTRYDYEQKCQQLNKLQQHYVEAQRSISYHNETEQELKEQLLLSEKTARTLTKQLDEDSKIASKAVEERTKALSEKLQFENKVQKLALQIQQLQNEKQLLQQHIAVLLNERLGPASAVSPHKLNTVVSQSRYASKEVPAALTQGSSSNCIQNYSVAVGEQRMNSSSPDLGIESDAGRGSSVELANVHTSVLKTVEIHTNTEADQENCQIKKETDCNYDENNMMCKSETDPFSNVGIITPDGPHDCAKVDRENAELKRKLIRNKKTLEDTYQKLRLANQRKSLIERDIKNQILKTQNVLLNVRTNLENEKK